MLNKPISRNRSPRPHGLGVWAALWECLGCCPACAAVAFMAEGCVMVAPGAKGSFPSSTDDATKPRNIIPLSNPHTRTTGFQGTRMYMPEPPRTKNGSNYHYYTAKNASHLSGNVVLVKPTKVVRRPRF